MPSFQVDADGDVEMSVPQPVYELIKAPQLAAWDQESLVKWLRERRRYEETMTERCRVTQESVEAVVRGIRATVEPNLLDYLARYEFQRDAGTLTDKDILDKVKTRVGEVMNGHIPDILEFFKARLKMNLAEQDVEARIVKYFVDFDRLVDEHGFASMLGAGAKNQPGYQDRMKSRCKLLMENLAPAMLKTEVKRLVSLQNREAKTDDIALHKLILERAKMQQRYHLMQQEVKEERKQSTRSDGAKKTEAKKPDAKSTGAKTATKKSESAGASGSTATPRPPPRDGCYFCKGPHVLSACPTATEEQKRESYQRMREEKIAKAKAARAARVPGHHQVVINELIELPYRADSGSDVNVLPAAALRELESCGAPVATTVMATPVYLERVGGDLLACRAGCKIDIMLDTAAGPVHLRNLDCVVVDDDEEEFLLGNPTLMSLGIDVDRQIEQLAVGHVEGVHDGDADDLPEDPELGRDDRSDVDALMDNILIEASDNGFSQSLMPTLRRVVADYRDLWRIRLGTDEPARVEPFHLVLKKDSQPIRCKPRRYAPLASAYMRNYVKELIQCGYVYPNNASRWASAVVPVRKPGG